MPLIISTGFPEKVLQVICEAVRCPVLSPINSVGIKVGLLVRQIADIYVNHHAVHYWDTVAPQVILEEAGGVFTFSDGQPLAYDLNSRFHHASATLASNGPRHAELIKKIGGLF